MENITMGEIESTLKFIAGIIGSLITIYAVFSKWYKYKITNKFDKVDEKFNEVYKKFKEVCEKIEELDIRLTDVERKRDQYERELGDSKKERGILARGELSALKILRAMLDKSQLDQDELAESIKEIEEYVFEKSH